LFTAGEAAQASFTKNIGVGGAFILASKPLPPGTHLSLSLRLPSASEPLQVDGEVRWVLDGKSGAPESEWGMGIKFSALDVDQLLTLNDYFASLAETVDLDQE
jgi:uncharacterized protein (TIGR02266 family)